MKAENKSEQARGREKGIEQRKREMCLRYVASIQGGEKGEGEREDRRKIEEQESGVAERERERESPSLGWRKNMI